MIYLYIKPLSSAMIVAGLIITMTAVEQADAKTTINVGEVTGSADSTHSPLQKKLKKLDNKYTNKQVFRETQSAVVLGNKNKKMISPNAGAAELLATAPGVHIMSENPQNGSGRYNISINGMGVGWWSGNTYRNQISVLFDGIPMNNQITNDGQWNSNQIPILAMIHGVNVIYGPGNPKDRWYDSLGGTINFVPLQPTTKANAKANLSVGSYGSKTASFSLNTGHWYGWSTVLAGGYTSANSFYQSPSNWPQHSWSVYMKTAHPFSNGMLTFGFYYEKSNATHSLTIPVTPIAGYSVNGYGKPGQLLSQQTSGFYYVPSSDLWYKNDIVDSYILYSQQIFDLGGGWTLKNTPWYRHAYRVHQAYFNYGASSYNPEAAEHYAPTNNSFGDRLGANLHSHYNDVDLGGWLSYQQYNTNEELWNPLLGTSQSNPYVYNNVELNTLFSNLYVQDTIKLMNNHLRITPGVALASFYTSMSDLVNPDTKSIYLTATPGAKTNFTRFEPSLGINYKFLKNFSFYANYSETYQNETDLAYGAYLQKIAINPADIPITRAVDYEAGLRYHNKTTNIGINYYHDYLTNLLNGVSGSITQFNASGYNLGNAIYQGVNVYAKWRPMWQLYVYGSANIQHSYYTKDYNNSGVSFNGVRLSGIPHYSFNLSVSYKFRTRYGILEPVITDQYSGGQSLYNNVTGGPTNQTINAYNIVNLSASYKTFVFNHIIPGAKETDFSVGVYNLLNRKYESDIYLSTGGYNPHEQPSLFAYAGAPLQVFGGVTVKF